MVPWYQHNYNFPLSGSVQQKIDPDWFFNEIKSEVGDATIEKEVFCNVASYGRQIAVMTNVLLSLAKKLELDPKGLGALKELEEIHERVGKVKEETRERLLENAKRSLDKLQESDVDALKQLIENYG